MKMQRLALMLGLFCVLVAVPMTLGGCVRAWGVAGGVRLDAPAREPAPPANPKEDMETVRHVVLFAFKPETPPETRAQIEQASLALADQIPVIHSVEWGTDLNEKSRAEGYTHCFVYTFSSRADIPVYVNHPAHVAFRQMALPHIEKLLILDYVPR